MNESQTVLLRGLTQQLRAVLGRLDSGGSDSQGALTVPSLISLAACVNDLGDLKEAKSLLLRALEHSSNATDGQVLSTTSAMISLGVLAGESGDPAEANRWFKEALDALPPSSADDQSPISEEAPANPRQFMAGVRNDLGHQGRAQRVAAAVSSLSNDIVTRLAGEPRLLLTSEGWTQSVLHQAVIAGEAIGTIWDEPMLRSGAAAEALGAKATNREKVKTYRERSWLLGLPHGNGYVYPAFQFDKNKRNVHEEVRSVNESLGAADDPWGVASWWVSVHARLDARPCDLAGTGNQEQLEAAAESVSELVG